MANYSTLKYSTVTAAGFAKEADVTTQIAASSLAIQTSILQQLDRQVDGGLASTIQFLGSIGSGNATTTLFNASYDGGTANG
jgi:hypothetical protein